MNKFSLLFLLFPLLQSRTVSNFSVDIKLIAPFNTAKIELQVVVKNLSATPVRVLKRRTQVFKRNGTASKANYIIELEQWKGNAYYLWEPTVETVIPSHNTGEEYVFLQKEKSITDTLHLAGHSFSDNLPWIFSPGLYRIRVSFNVSEWNSVPANNSNWVEFVVQ